MEWIACILLVYSACLTALYNAQSRDLDALKDAVKQADNTVKNTLHQLDLSEQSKAAEVRKLNERIDELHRYIEQGGASGSIDLAIETELNKGKS